MPNIIIETSRTDIIPHPDRLLKNLNANLWQTAQFSKAEDIKSRIFYPNHVAIGLSADHSNDYIFVHFYLMPGRNPETQAMLVQCITDTISQHLKEHTSKPLTGKLQICVNPIELSEAYHKQIIG